MKTKYEPDSKSALKKYEKSVTEYIYHSLLGNENEKNIALANSNQYLAILHNYPDYDETAIRMARRDGKMQAIKDYEFKIGREYTL